MKKRTLLFTVVALIVIGVVVFLIYSLSSGTLAIKKYAEWEQDGYTFTYKGSFGKISRLLIEKDGKTLGEHELEADASLFDSEKDMKSARFLHVGENGEAAILVPYALDEDGDAHYLLLELDADGTCSLTDVRIVNPSIDEKSGRTVSEEAQRIDIGEPLPDGRAPYESSATHTEYTLDGTTLIPFLSYSVTYHSETDIYRFSVAFYDDELGGFGDSEDEWLLPDEYEAARAELDEMFAVPLPE